MLVPAFQLHLSNAILQGLATVGYYDGKHPALTCATSAGKVFIHSPHDRAEDSAATGVDPAAAQIRFLNINRRITALASGRLNPEGEGDTLLVGTQTNLLAYDVEKNSDTFYKDVPDGVSALIFGHVQSVEAPLVIVGGNCSIQGFDHEGTEQFWAVTGDNVTALAFCDADGDGKNELLVGSDDFEIRIFQNEDVLSETTETDKIVGLCPIQLKRYGYALANGTVGVYDGTSRKWRVKSKARVTCIGSFDLDADGKPELISGWASGKFEVRRETNGEVVYKDTFGAPVSAICQADYRMDGREEVVVCALDGEVRGYLPVEATAEATDTAADEAAMVELAEAKKALEMELRGLESNMKAVKSGEGLSAGVIPPSTSVNLSVELSPVRGCVELVIATNNDTIIKSVVVFALDGSLFDGESHMVYPAAATGTVRVPLRPPKNSPTELSLQVMVGARGSSVQYHVFELKHQLPRFSMYSRVERGGPAAPDSNVSFILPERMQRVAMWVNKSFSAAAGAVKVEGDSLNVGFVSLRDGKALYVHASPADGGRVTIRCDDMETAAEVVQDLCSDVGVHELESVADFPAEMSAFREVLMKVDEYNAIRLKLTAEMADSSNMVKTLVIKSEDSRILGDMRAMKRMYSELYSLNNELIGEYTKRSNNHQELLAALKEVNLMIQKAARLRVGAAKTRVVNACRGAIKANNIHSLFQIISQGRAVGGDS